MNEQAVPDTPMAAGAVRRVGEWAVGVSGGEDFAVSRRCRHQLADLSKGTVDADGCLVCPGHASRYDVTTHPQASGTAAARARVGTSVKAYTNALSPPGRNPSSTSFAVPAPAGLGRRR